jgi:hypothetical protein
MEPLLMRWLHVGGRRYEHGCTQDMQPQAYLECLANRINSKAFADDLICLYSKITDLRTQAENSPSTWIGLPSLSRKNKGDRPLTQCRPVMEH